ncbi:PaaI family thioesterase [Crenobacter sp. SG2303]|uniref:PaaI family thioesterase n=1 Tax=Crenobacter oryzisoli TaxID=3056844 RepID=A0ABT7XTA7_9NEIS|nr:MULTISPECIES: PaaI family thioesterase [unclassified Crenobacter]MDN0076958.1 PaaI family thioesterase [Crenobacter sp. SG2303]MDN0082006.1 PaaI family thioesterase [Crenobacter sp. SG2305]
MSEFMERFCRLREEKKYGELIAAIPYAQLMGVEFSEDEQGDLVFWLPFYERNVGNTVLPALHGGLIGGFLENAALIHLMWNRESQEAPKIVDFSLDYLRSGKAKPLFARCEITKQGKRVAHVLIEAWQEDRAKPIAVARAHFLLSSPAA